jgi:starch phosphorylase
VPSDDLLVAYFSLEFGVDERLPVYAGGLGVLAGDHLKAASDLEVPLVGVGLFYREGYFRQEVGADGRQAERYDERDPAGLGLEDTGVTVTVEVPAGPVDARAWRTNVGRVPLVLLDADGLSGALYGGDREHRLGQELLLGLGGVRALRELGLAPTVFHLNEGHAAFTALERLRALVEDDGLPVEDALEAVRRATVFTTHTPVPAGNERFDVTLVRRHLEPLAERIGLGWDALVALGRADGDEAFGLTPFALRTAARRNGVSRLHGKVARGMWAGLWPARAAEDVPIGHVTNGVHPRTWLSEELAGLLAAQGVELDRGKGWERAEGLDLDELAGVRRARKEALLSRVGALDADALTLGFARRFATYKRANLLLSDPERFAALLADADRPVQLLVAGKAHPADGGGKEIIEQVVAFARGELAGGRVVFLEGYDMALARALVQGVDVWVNVPRRLEEASGTSGMKAGLNGALNLSVADGWWDEGQEPETGWTIPGDGAADQDAADAAELYRLLEEEVVPAYYAGGDAWLRRARTAVARTGARFSSHRMVSEYLVDYYEPAHHDRTAG